MLVTKTRAGTYGHGMGNISKAKCAAGRICAELHLLGYPGAQIRQTNFHRVGPRNFTKSSYCTYEIYYHEDLPPEVVKEAKTSYTFIHTEDRGLKAAVWALTEWYSHSWVQANRLCAVVGFYNYCRASQYMFDHIDGRAFEHEVTQNLNKLGKDYHRFYGIKGSRKEVYNVKRDLAPNGGESFKAPPKSN